jgi:cytochrome c biogenesis protein CcmG, thiol:disulfide interchange protein DsbE
VKKFAIVIALFAALGGLLAYALYLSMTGQYSPREIPSPLIGKPLPNFSLASLHEPKRMVTPQSLRGRVYLLNVWASWCAECRVEHPFFNEIAKRKIIPIVGLNYKDKREDAFAWLKQLGDPYEMSLSDTEGRIGIDLGVYGVPETFVIDKEGVIRMKHIGAVNAEVWSKKLLPMIQKLSS